MEYIQAKHRDHLLIFVHMHKCAGSAIRKAAQTTGLVLPLNHRNGNAVDEHGKAVRYADMEPQTFRRFIRQSKRLGIDFIAMEWDVPPPGLLLRPYFTVFTALRDPLARAISDYRFDKLRGGTPASVTFREYFNKGFTAPGSYHTSSNYYVRKLCRLKSVEPVQGAHYDKAVAMLERFQSVIVMGVHDMNKELAKLGIHELREANVTSKMAMPVNMPPEALEVSEEDQRWYVSKNQFDIDLVKYFSRPIH